MAALPRCPGHPARTTIPVRRRPQSQLASTAITHGPQMPLQHDHWRRLLTPVPPSLSCSAPAPIGPDDPAARALNPAPLPCRHCNQHGVVSPSTGQRRFQLQPFPSSTPLFTKSLSGRHHLRRSLLAQLRRRCNPSSASLQRARALSAKTKEKNERS